MSWRIGKRSAIGIDLGTTRIKAAQLARSPSGWHLVAGANYARTEGDGVLVPSEMDRFLGVLDRAGFRGDRVVVGAPRPMLRAAVVDAPPVSSGAPVAKICAAEFARMYRMSPGSCQLHVREVPAAKARPGTCQMSVSGVSNEDAESLVHPFDRVGMVVEAIDLAAEARCRVARSVCGEVPTLAALLDIGWSGIGLSVFREGDAVYHRWLSDGGLCKLVESARRSFSIDAASAEAVVSRVGIMAPAGEGYDGLTTARVLGLGREYAEGLFHDILRSLAYVLDRYPGEVVERFFLNGGGASLPGLAEYLGELAGLNFEVLTPGQCGVRGGPLIDDAAMHTAIGHAMWGMVDDK
ncbi:MAG: pilus assembly protein PilM [Phycisphaerales bacterium JB054]